MSILFLLENLRKIARGRTKSLYIVSVWFIQTDITLSAPGMLSIRVI